MKSFILLVMGLCASIASAQALSYVPAPRAVYISSDGTGAPGTWEPESGTSSGTVSYVPQPVGAYCSNDGTGNQGTWVPCSVGGSGGSVSITSTDGSITFSPSTCTGTCTAIVNRALTLNTLTFTTAGEAVTFPGGSQIFEDSSTNLNVEATGAFVFSGASGLVSGDLYSTDNTNVGSIFQILGGTLSGQSVDTSVEVVNPDSYGVMKLSSISARLLNSANARETQLGVGTASGGTPAAFAPKFAVGNVLIAETEREINSTNGALSAPAKLFNGTPVASGGSGTTTLPLVLIQPNGTTATNWSTVGSMFGINAASGFSGDLMNVKLNGTTQFQVSAFGSVVGAHFGTTGNCISSASPAVCSASTAGSVVVAATASTVVVDTTAVTANSQILLTFDESLSTRLTVTCNTATIQQPVVSARTAGTSFTITVPATVSTNPDCISYLIVN